MALAYFRMMVAGLALNCAACKPAPETTERITLASFDPNIQWHTNREFPNLQSDPITNGPLFKPVHPMEHPTIPPIYFTSGGGRGVVYE